MTKSACLDCIDKYEKSKQRKRKAKQRQKKKSEPRSLIESPYSQLRPSLAPSPNQNLTDLLSVLKLQQTMAQQQNTPQLESLERTPKPKTPNEALSQVADNYLLGVDVAKNVPVKLYDELKETIKSVTEPIQFLTNMAGKHFSYLESKLPKPLEVKTPTAEQLAGQKALERAGRLVDTEPLERGANPTPVQFIATAPPANLITDIQRGTEKWKTKIPEFTGQPTPIKLVGPIESEYADVLGGQQTLMDLMMKPPVASPFSQPSMGEIPEVFEDASGEEPLPETPQTVSSPESLITGEEKKLPTYSSEQLVGDQPRRRGRPSKEQQTRERELQQRQDYIRSLVAEGMTEDEATAFADESEGYLFPEELQYARLREASNAVTAEDLAQIE
jgi:hypothetical protein